MWRLRSDRYPQVGQRGGDTSRGGRFKADVIVDCIGEPLLNPRSLFLRIPALELLPPPRCIVIPSAEGVRVNFRSHPDRGVPQALGYRRKVHSVRQ